MGGTPRARARWLARAAVAAALCLSMPTGVGVAAAAQTAHATAPAGKSPGTRSAGAAATAWPSGYQQLPVKKPDAFQLAVATAVGQAKKARKKVPIPEGTTAYSTMWANPDGTVGADNHILPQRAKAGGAWAPIDTHLAIGSDGQVHTKATVSPITVSAGGTAPLAVTDDGNGHKLTLTWPNPLPPPSLSGSTATYASVLPGVDLKVTASATGVSHVLVVHDAAAAANPALSTIKVGVTGTGLTVSTTGDGGLQATTANGTKVFAGQPPHMWDSAATAPAAAGASRRPDTSASVDAATPAVKAPAGSGPHTATMPVQVKDGTISLTTDPAVLHGPGIVYPVIIDPQWSEQAQNWTEFASSGEHVYDSQQPFPWGGYDNSVVRVGNSGGTVFRSLLQFNADVLTPNYYTNFLVVTHANVELTFQTSCITTDVWAAGPFDSGTTWSNQDGYGVWSGGAHVIGTNNCSANPWNPINIDDTAQVQTVFANGGHTYTVGLRAHNEGAGGGYGGINVINNGPTYDANMQITFRAEPWFDSVQVGSAPVGNHGATSTVCGDSTGTAGYLPMTTGSVPISASIGDWDSANVQYSVNLNDETNYQGTGSGGYGTVTTVPYSNSGSPGPRSGGATVAVSGGFPSTTSPNTTTFGSTNVNQIYDGDTYQMFVQAWDTDPTLDNAFTTARGTPGTNYEYPYIVCYFHAAMSAPGQPQISSSSFPQSGQHITAGYPTVGTAGTITVTDSAPHTPVDHFDWALNTSSTNEGANNCGSVAGIACGTVGGFNSTSVTNAAINIPGSGEHWGDNYIYVSAVDKAGNVSSYARYDFFLAQAFQPVSFGDVTGDGVPDVMDVDANGNLVTYITNLDPTAGSSSGTATGGQAANAVQAAPASAAPNGSSWASALITHRGAERVQPTDDLFAWDRTGDGNGHLYYYFNAVHLTSTAAAGQNPNIPANAFTQTQQALVTRPLCTPTAADNWCIGYSSSWNNVLQVAALGPVNGGCTITSPTTACKTNLITVESDPNGNGTTRVWLFSPAGVGQLRNPVLLSTSTAGGGWDWSQMRLLTPGNAAGHPGGSGGLPDLWVEDPAGTLWQFANGGNNGTGLGDVSAKTMLGSANQFAPYKWIHPGVDTGGNPDVWAMWNDGQISVLLGNPGTASASPLSATQTTATAVGWATGAAPAAVEGRPLPPGIAGPLVSAVTTPGNPARQICLDDLNGGTANSTTVIDAYDCNGTFAQDWSFNADGTVRTMGANPAAPPNKCLDTGGSLLLGAKVTLYDCTGNNGFQVWKILPSAGNPNLFSLYNPASGLCLDDTGYGTNNFNPFQLWQCLDGDTAQQFTLPTAAAQAQSVEAESVWIAGGGFGAVEGDCCSIGLSNGAEVRFPGTAAGQSITFNWYVPNAGTYTFAPSLTKTDDRGQVTVSVDSGQPLPNVFDGYQASGVSETAFAFGSVFLPAGPHTFTFTTSGTDSGTVGQRYVIGIDKLTLTPVANKAAQAALTVTPSSGYAPLAVTANASASTGGAAQISSYTFDFGDGTVVGPQAGATASHTYTGNPTTYQVKATVTDTAGVTAVAEAPATITPPVGPSAVLNVASAAAVGVPTTVDASRSKAGSSAIQTYAFSFGDGASTGPQAAATASHTYTAAGTYPVTVTETDANGLTATATQQLTVAASIPISHVGRVTVPDAQVVTSTSATEHVASVTSTGDALLVGVLLGNTGSGTVSATDTQGNSYQVVADQSDGAGDRTLLLAAFNTKALTTADTVTISFPSTKEHHVTLDEYSGVSGLDQAKSATGAANTAFSSGATASTSAPNELVVGLVGSEGGSAATWTTPTGALPDTTVNNDHLGQAWQAVTASGAYSASGTSAIGQWMAEVATFKPITPPALTAALTATPSSVQTGQTVTVSGTGSTAGANPISSYTFDFGDGTVVGPQAGATATHAYSASGTYTVKLTVADSSGATNATTKTVTVTTAPPPATIGYVGRAASVTGSTTVTSVALHPSSNGVKAGDALVVSAMLTNVKSGSVSATDTQGNAYTLVVNQADGGGDATVVLAATNVKALTSSDTITLTIPSTGEQHVAIDEFSGVTTVDQHASATGTAATFNSGNAPVTTAANELLFGVAGVQGGANATWTGGYTALPTLFVSSDQLATAYRTVTATGAYNASGTAAKTWMAAVVTLK